MDVGPSQGKEVLKICNGAQHTTIYCRDRAGCTTTSMSWEGKRKTCRVKHNLQGTTAVPTRTFIKTHPTRTAAVQSIVSPTPPLVRYDSPGESVAMSRGLKRYSRGTVSWCRHKTHDNQPYGREGFRPTTAAVHVCMYQHTNMKHETFKIG